jgi:hypothetical protein
MANAYDAHHPDPMSILNGHRPSHSGRHIKVHRSYDIVEAEPHKKKSRLQPGRMYRRHREAKYIIKPEPFNINSQRSDPELLGPQRTYMSEGNSTINPQKNNGDAALKSSKETMTKDGCISLIGQDKFDSYIEKYDGEKGALKRCLILKRMRG